MSNASEFIDGRLTSQAQAMADGLVAEKPEQEGTLIVVISERYLPTAKAVKRLLREGFKPVDTKPGRWVYEKEGHDTKVMLEPLGRNGGYRKTQDCLLTRFREVE